MQWNGDENRWQRLQDRDLPHYRDRRTDGSKLKSSRNDISAGPPRKAAFKPKSSKEHLSASQPRKTVSAKKASPATHTKAAFDEVRVRSCRAVLGCLMCHLLVHVSDLSERIGAVMSTKNLAGSGRPKIDWNVPCRNHSVLRMPKFCPRCH